MSDDNDQTTTPIPPPFRGGFASLLMGAMFGEGWENMLTDPPSGEINPRGRLLIERDDGGVLMPPKINWARLSPDGLLIVQDGENVPRAMQHKARMIVAVDADGGMIVLKSRFGPHGTLMFAPNGTVSEDEAPEPSQADAPSERPDEEHDGPWYPTLSGNEIERRMENLMPVEVLHRGEWEDPHGFLDRNGAAALDGLIVAARVPKVFRSVRADTDKPLIGRTALVDGVQYRIAGRNGLENPETGFVTTIYLDSFDGKQGITRDYPAGEMIEVQEA